MLCQEDELLSFDLKIATNQCHMTTVKTIPSSK